MEYASKFVHAAGTKFQSTTIAVILGTAYVKKGLPEVRFLPFSLSFFTYSHLMQHTNDLKVRTSSSNAPRSIPCLHPPRRRKMHNRPFPTPSLSQITATATTAFPLPHNRSDNRHDPLPTPPSRRKRSLPNAPASRLPQSRLLNSRAGIPRCTCILAVIADIVSWC